MTVGIERVFDVETAGKGRLRLEWTPVVQKDVWSMELLQRSNVQTCCIGLRSGGELGVFVIGSDTLTPRFRGENASDHILLLLLTSN